MVYTDKAGIREIALLFAHHPIKQNEEYPFIVSHPFIEVFTTIIQTENGQELVNVLEEDGEEKFRKFIIKRLRRIHDPMGFFSMLSKAYRFTFLDHVCKYLGDDDLGRCLRYIWRCDEHFGVSDVIEERKLVRLFRRSTKSNLMDEDELSVVQDLPESITVYRGINSMCSKDPRDFSWTLSRETAEWYAGRFEDEDQSVFQAELPKSGVLAYFSTDKEIVADPKKLKNIQKIR